MPAPIIRHSAAQDRGDGLGGRPGRQGTLPGRSNIGGAKLVSVGAVFRFAFSMVSIPQRIITLGRSASPGRPSTPDGTKLTCSVPSELFSISKSDTFDVRQTGAPTPMGE